MGDLKTPSLAKIVTPVGYDGTHWYALTVDDAGQLQVDVLTSALPTGAATAANQTTMITALQLIDDLRAALDSVGTDELDVKVEASVLPTGAATAANQTTMITALQLIDDLRAALDSVGTDELDVNVEASVLPDGAAEQGTLQNIDGHLKNQVFGYAGVYHERIVELNASAGSNALNGSVVPAGEVWVVTTVMAYNADTNPSEIYIGINDGVTNHLLNRVLSPGVDVPVQWSGQAYLETGDKIKAYFGGCALNDDLYAFFNGYKMEV